jgi:hypothetical protein
MRSVWLAAVLAAAVMLLGAPASVAAPTSCPSGYDWTSVDVDSSYGRVDRNKTGYVCVQTVPRKGATPRVVDDHPDKKA